MRFTLASELQLASNSQNNYKCSINDKCCCFYKVAQQVCNGCPVSPRWRRICTSLVIQKKRCVGNPIFLAVAIFFQQCACVCAGACVRRTCVFSPSLWSSSSKRQPALSSWSSDVAGSSESVLTQQLTDDFRAARRKSIVPTHFANQKQVFLPISRSMRQRRRGLCQPQRRSKRSSTDEDPAAIVHLHKGKQRQRRCCHQ